MAILIGIVTACIVLFGVRWANSLVKPVHALGAVDGRLAECPDRPNCVSSQAAQSGHYIEPLPIATSSEESLRMLTVIIESMPRAHIVSAAEEYLHVECHSLVFGFVDDVEFVVDGSAGVIHCRSASRVGHSDLGVNRKRIEAIRVRYKSLERD